MIACFVGVVAQRDGGSCTERRLRMAMGRMVSLAQGIEHEAGYQVNYHYESQLEEYNVGQDGQQMMLFHRCPWCGVRVVPARPVPASLLQHAIMTKISSKARLVAKVRRTRYSYGPLWVVGTVAG